MTEPVTDPRNNWGFNATSDLPPESVGPFTPLGDLEVANYDGTEGIDISFDTDLQEMSRTERFRESWTFVPILEPVENGSQRLTGLSYTRDSWRPLSADSFEQKPLHSETGYLLWDGANGHAYRVVAMPRGVTLLAVAANVTAQSDELLFVADPTSDELVRGGVQSNPILTASAMTIRYTSTMRIASDSTWFSYDDSVEQSRDGQDVRHTDSNRLYRI